jgi:hypothetical protein
MKTEQEKKEYRDALIKQRLKKGRLVYDADERDATGKRKPRDYGRNAYKRAKRELEKQKRKEEIAARVQP